MPRRVRLSTLVLTAFMVLPTFSPLAQPSEKVFGTLSVEFYDERVGGALVGCVLGFGHLLQDFVYEAGRPVYIDGSVGIEVFSGRVMLSVKLVPADVTAGSNGQPSLTVFTPENAYLTFGPISTAGKEIIRFRCDQGGFCAGYGDIELLQAFLRSEDTGFEVSYQRSSGGLDVATMIELPTNPDRRGWQDVGNFGHCVQSLLRATVGQQRGH